MKGPVEPAPRRHESIARGFPDYFPGAPTAAGEKPRIVARRWGDFSVRDPLAALVIIYGLGEHSGRYTALANHMNAHADVLVFSFDHRGHGRSDGPRQYADTLNELIEDIATYVDAVASQLPSTMPLFILGHSMGGLLAGVYALRAPRPRVAGFIFSGPGFEPGESITSTMIMGGRVLGRVAPSAGVASLEPGDISSIPDEVNRYVQDPLNSHEACTAGLGLAMLDAVDVIAASRTSFDYPALYFYGKDDKLVNRGGVDRFFEGQKHADKTLWVAENSRHEVFYDKDAAAAFKLVTEWIVARSKPKA
jgi:acylglycerol lipase